MHGPKHFSKVVQDRSGIVPLHIISGGDNFDARKKLDFEATLEKENTLLVILGSLLKIPQPFVRSEIFLNFSVCFHL